MPDIFLENLYYIVNVLKKQKRAVIMCFEMELILDPLEKQNAISA